MAIEAVIWDFGGVFTSSPFEAFARYETENGVPKDLIRRVNSTNPDTNAWALFERNEIDTQGFDRLFLEESTALGHPIPGSHVLPLLSGSVRPRMVAALKACKAQFKVGCITNNMVSRNSLASLQRSLKAVNEAQNRATNGLRVEKASDDPSASSSIMAPASLMPSCRICPALSSL